ncbi:MAG: hypothetical protein E6J47_01420 [Chloroflexi bacterium]|nr:MAG: hypothetical protein E6J47_01420 [Chloroflexota bacterium]
MRAPTRPRLIRAGLIAAALTAGGALAVQAALPSASDSGQAHAAAGAANGQAASHLPQNGAKPSSVSDRLSANQERILSNLNDVVDRLTGGGHAAQNAIDALHNVIDRLTNDDIGLNRAMEAVSGAGHPALPDAAIRHPVRP